MTTAPHHRALAAKLVIVAAACFGAHALLVDPAARRLAEVRAEIAQCALAQSHLQAVRSAMPALAASTREADRRARIIAGRSAPAQDQGELFSRLAELAAAHRIRVDQLEPFQPRRAPAPAPSADHKPEPPPVRETEIGYSMTLIGSYADLAGFLRSVQHDLGLTRVLSVRIRPDPEGGPTGVTASVQTVHRAVTPSIAAANPAAAPHAQGRTGP